MMEHTLAAPTGGFCRFSDNSPAAWSVFFSLMLVPVLPDFLAPFAMPLPFLFSLCSKKGRVRIQAIFSGRRWLLIAAALFVAVSFFGILPATSFSGALLTSGLWAFCFLSMLGVAASLRGENDLHLALCGLYAGLLVQSVLAILQGIHFTTNMPFWNPFWAPLEKIVMQLFPFIEVDLSFSAERSTAAFTNSGVFGFYLVMCAPFCFYLISRAKNLKQAVLFALPLAAAVISLMLTYSRMSYITFLALLFYLLIGYALVHFRKLKRSYRVLMGVTLTLAIPIGVVILAFLLPDAVTDRFLSAFRADNSINARLAIWGKAVPWLFSREPWRLLFGFGTGVQCTWEAFRSISRWLTEATGFDVPHAHNLFIQLLMEGGILRLAGFVFLMLAAFFRCFKAVQTQSDKGKYFLISLSGFFLALLLNGLTDYVFVDPKICFLFFAFLGVIFVLPTITFPEEERAHLSFRLAKRKKRN